MGPSDQIEIYAREDFGAPALWDRFFLARTYHAEHLEIEALVGARNS